MGVFKPESFKWQTEADFRKQHFGHEMTENYAADGGVIVKSVTCEKCYELLIADSIDLEAEAQRGGNDES